MRWISWHEAEALAGHFEVLLQACCAGDVRTRARHPDGTVQAIQPTVWAQRKRFDRATGALDMWMSLVWPVERSASDVCYLPVEVCYEDLALAGLDNVPKAPAADRRIRGGRKPAGATAQDKILAELDRLLAAGAINLKTRGCTAAAQMIQKAFPSYTPKYIAELIAAEYKDELKKRQPR
jgi:hypothetical protein